MRIPSTSNMLEEKMEEKANCDDVKENKTEYNKFNDNLLISGIFTEATISILTQNLQLNNMEVLHISGSDLSFPLEDRHVEILVDALIQADITVNELALTHHDITDAGLQAVGKLLKPVTQSDSISTRPTLQHLNVRANKINGECFESMNFSSSDSCSLVTLDVSYNVLSAEGKSIISEMIYRNKVLKGLYINSCDFDLPSLVMIITNLRYNTTLQCLEMDRPLTNVIMKKEEIVDHLSRILLQSYSLEHISLRFLRISDFGARLLSESLPVNDSLLVLNLESNEVGIRGAEALASYLAKKTSNGLQKLYLSYNSIGDDGARAMGEALEVNRSLDTLTLKNNNIRPAGLTALAEGLKKNTRLNYISLFGNDFNNKNGKEYYELLNGEYNNNFETDIEVYIVDENYYIANTS